MQERRELPRWLIGRKAKVKLGEEAVLGSCYIRDLNLKGLCLFLSEQLDPQREHHARLQFDEQFEINLVMKVAWMQERKWGFIHGMIFCKIVDADKNRIFDYINTKFAQEIQRSWWGRSISSN